MTTRDKYTTFNRHSKNYRKPVHRVPKWTKLSFREIQNILKQRDGYLKGSTNFLHWC